MSWYKRTPRVKEPQKHVPHRRTSPATEKMMEESKNRVKLKPTEDLNKPK